MKKKIILLGASGSIGKSALEIIKNFPDELELYGISGHNQAEKTIDIANKFKVPFVAISGDSKPKQTNLATKSKVLLGKEGISQLIKLQEADIILVAISGFSGLQATLEAVKTGKIVALANKEALVTAGKFIMQEAKQHNTTILPVDSEHNALLQCLLGNVRVKDSTIKNLTTLTKNVKKAILTASGGPFRTFSKESLRSVTVKDALKHPNFSMGQKITVDSASMANKGLELMEARWLFDLSPSCLDVVIHPEQKIHAMAQFDDGSFIAQMCPPSMIFPIHYCLFYPEKKANPVKSIDFTQAAQWNFEYESLKKFPCLKLAKECLIEEKSAPIIFNSANEIAVHAFLSEKIRFLDIPVIIEACLQKAKFQEPDSIEEVLHIDKTSRIEAQSIINSL